MRLEERIKVLIALGDHFKDPDASFGIKLKEAEAKNPWFTRENIMTALGAIESAFLKPEFLSAFSARYQLTGTNSRVVGLVMAGNIPMVGFHDLLCVFLSGHKALVKYSEKDNVLIPHLVQLMIKTDPRAAKYFQSTDRLRGFDAIIATGSNNSARYFEYYFGKYPHIIRRNRNGVGVVHKGISTDDLYLLGKDVFSYFGLGCRNVSKLYIEEGFDLPVLMDNWTQFNDITQHNKYKNNFDYTYALYLLNKEEFYSNDCLIVKPDVMIPSRIASVHYEYYSNEAALQSALENASDAIQCVVSGRPELYSDGVHFGESQTPRLDQFADGVDTMAFLSNL